MKLSIKKLMSSLQFNMLVALLIVTATGLIALASYATQQRIENIETQVSLVKKALILDRDDLKMAQIESEGIANRLPILIDKLKNDEFYEILNQMLTKESEQRHAFILTLNERSEALSKAMKNYFHSTGKVTENRRTLQRAVDSYLVLLQPLSLLQAKVLTNYLHAVLAGTALALLWLLILASQVKRASATILRDIHALMKQDNSVRESSGYATTEINRIALKMRSEGSETLSPSKQDPVTQLPNYESIKSLLEKRPVKSKNLHTSVCVFAIDNYAKLVNHYPQSVINPVLIKIASIMKLHQRQNDYIGRIDDALFIAVLVRPEKKKAFEDCDHIRQMIADNRFKLPHSSVAITLSGGFTIKTPSQTLDDAVKNAKSYLKMAQEQGGNIIAEVKNTPKIL